MTNQLKRIFIDPPIKQWKELLAEIIGISILIIFACGPGGPDATTFSLSITAGMTVIGILEIFLPVSGAHINPAVTIGLLVVGLVDVPTSIWYIVAQLVGATAGSAALNYITDDRFVHPDIPIGVNLVPEGIGIVRATAVEWILTAVLLLAAMAAIDPVRLKTPGVKLPISIAMGLTVFVNNMVGIKYTSCSMNPARTFGPALINGFWTDHWVFWVGPVGGAVTGAVLYKYVFTAQEVGEEERTIEDLTNSGQKNVIPIKEDLKPNGDKIDNIITPC